MIQTSEAQAAWSLVDQERRRQDMRWGSQRHLAPERWLTILTEEVGEVAAEVLGGDTRQDFYIEELVQVAAVAVAALEGALARKWAQS